MTAFLFHHLDLIFDRETMIQSRYIKGLYCIHDMWYILDLLLSFQITASLHIYMFRIVEHIEIKEHWTKFAEKIIWAEYQFLYYIYCNK